MTRPKAANSVPGKRSTVPYVVYWNNIPSPYLVARLNAVAARGNVKIEGWFCARTESDRSWAVREEEFRFDWRYLPGRRIRVPGGRGHYFSLPVGLLTRHRPDLLVSLYAEPAFLAGWMAARAARTRVAFRFLPTFESWVPRSQFKERLKGALFKRTDGFKTSGSAGRAALEGYGVDPRRIHVVTQSIETDHWRRERESLRPIREQLRAEYGATGRTFLYVGRLWRGKGIDDLLTAYERLAELDTSLLLAGDGVDEKELRVAAEQRGLRNVQFLGFRDHDELARVYAAADVLVFPTLGDPHGLVVEEAMASGLPVISTDAAGDIRLRLPEGVAGFVVRPADPDALASRMRLLALDPMLAQRMGEAAVSIAGLRGHDKYAQDFECFVERVITMPRAG